MPQYTVRDPETGRTITFNWSGAQPPTDEDLAEVFASAGPAEAPLTRQRQDPGTLPALMSGHAPGSAPPPEKSVGGFLGNAVRDIPAIPKAVVGAAQSAARYNFFNPATIQTFLNDSRKALRGERPQDPLSQVGVDLANALVKNPKGVIDPVVDKITHPLRTAGEAADAVGDYAYDQPISAAMDASVVLGGASAGARMSGRAPRLANALGRLSRATDPVNAVGQGVGRVTETMGSGAEAAGEAMMRKALNMSDADVRARGGAERTALEHRIPATAAGDAKLDTVMDPLRQRQQTVLANMPDVLVTSQQLPRSLQLEMQRWRTRGSDPARYDAAVRHRTEALTDPNFTTNYQSVPGTNPVNGRYPTPVSAQVLHENKQALQRRAADANAYIAHPELRAEGDALAARAGDYRQMLNDASPEYGAINAEFEPLMALQQQLQQRALHRGGHEVPYAVGLGLQAARGDMITPAAGILSSLALRNPRLASGLAQGAFDMGQGISGTGRAIQFASPAINPLDALQRAILRRRATGDNGR